MSRPSLALTTLLGVVVLLAGATVPATLGAQVSPTAVLHVPTAAPATTAATHDTARGAQAPVGEASATAAGPWAAWVAVRVATPATRDVALAHGDANVADVNVGAGRNLALMGVGAAAVVIGLLVGDTAGTAIAVGGGLVGLYGLYLFLK